MGKLDPLGMPPIKGLGVWHNSDQGSQGKNVYCLSLRAYCLLPVSIKIKIYGNFKGLYCREVKDSLDAGLGRNFRQDLIDLLLRRGNEGKPDIKIPFPFIIMGHSRISIDYSHKFSDFALRNFGRAEGRGNTNSTGTA